MRLYIITVLTFFFTISCKKDKDVAIVLPLNDNSLPSGAITSVNLLTKTASYLDFEISVAVFRDSKNMENQLTANNFQNETISLFGSTLYVTLKNFTKVNQTTSSPYSALLLMDQSGSISSTDFFNRRLDAASAFVRKLGAGDNVSLWSFQGNTYRQISNSFNRDTATLLMQIEDLRYKETGGTPLYASQQQAIDYTKANANNTDKAVLTFTDGEDNASGSITNTIVTNNAVSKNIKLFNIGLGSASMDALQQQALASKGAFMFAEDAPQLISMFGNLGKLLNKTAVYYKTTWRLTKNAGSFGTGTYTLSVKVSLPYGGTIEIPYLIKY